MYGSVLIFPAAHPCQKNLEYPPRLDIGVSWYRIVIGDNILCGNLCLWFLDNLDQGNCWYINIVIRNNIFVRNRYLWLVDNWKLGNIMVAPPYYEINTNCQWRNQHLNFLGGKWGARTFSGEAKVKNAREACCKICAFWSENALKYAVLKLKLVCCCVKLKKIAQSVRKFAVLGWNSKNK